MTIFDMTTAGKGITVSLIIVLYTAALYDIRVKKIPNLITFPTMTIAVAYHAIMNGMNGLLFSIGGIGAGIGLLVVFYLLGGMGAGDVKLMGAVGGLLGPKGVLMASLFTAIAGGVYALILAALIRYLNKNTRPQLCYGVAIAFGTLASVFYGMYLK